MLQPQDRLYFIHIPKTAGTTLIPHLDARFHVDEICPAQLWPQLLLLPQETLPRYRLFRGHFGAKGLDCFLPEPPLRITMLRHPVPLALSTYQFILREPGTHLHRLVKSGKMSFAEFLQHPKARLAVTNKQVSNLGFELRYQPGRGPALSAARGAKQWVNSRKVVCPSPQERLEGALAVLQECVFFGLVERFDESIALLSWTFGWPPAGPVQKLMVAPPASRRGSALSASLETQIRAYNPLDLALYEAAEKRFEERLAAMREDLQQYARAGETMPDSLIADPQLLYKLLKRHYRCHQPKQVRPAGACIRMTFAEPLPGSGWHRREEAPSEGIFYRWTGPGRVSTLAFPLGVAEDLVITFLVLDAASRTILESLQLTVNGQPVALRSFGRGSHFPRYYQTFVPQDIFSSRTRHIRLAFRVAKTAHRERFYWDPRAVGVAIGGVELAPAREAPLEEVLMARLKKLRRPISWRLWLLQTPWFGPRLRKLYLYLRAVYFS
ncbi:hypothetical protein Noc_0733 [Nitrosococcus oceani ATCC 19707]|uniref:Sulfotransferase family protein n=2 Tax=Nitrosococcus oceani TaxID=1229 RepID=Q3JD49_NITOC|nr:hypothetical protein [Nitrosococcus oceani]ABA57247.1 hypothetical protein Noc_0733 [Nitrosococcus oceani ATCC 19707]EDZ66427.1 hypothetical protein NOC27_3107 [Nitrosococcus oceani AFC27]KFI20219.1 hypothetical protein IB75_03680 [Nitrosococcus oceani C-27]GEM20118.1 hypothetical protein NONS58_15250 [Nitrosococcus oceani]